MRVALVCPYAWDRFGGVQSHVDALARVLASRGHEVRIFAPWSIGKTARGASTNVTFVGRAVGIPANGSIAPLAFGPGAAVGIRRALRAFSPDVLHLHEPLIPSLSLLALVGSNVPAVGTFHASANSSLAYRVSRPVLARAARRLKVRTVVSDAARDLVARYHPGTYLTTPNGVEVERFATAEPADLGPGPIVLFLGRIERRKGLEILIRAMGRLRDIGATLVVAGAGPEERTCRSVAERLDVPARFLGRIAEGDKPSVYRAADVYCAPGTGGESFGIVLVEALAAGVPVVCSDLAGYRAVADPAAALVPPNDPIALAEALRLILTDPDEAARRRAFSSARAASFDWARLASDVESIYKSARVLG